MNESPHPPEELPPSEAPEPAKSFVRFERSQRVEHAIFLAAFTVLAITGLAQKFATAAGGEFILSLLGGIEASRIIHRSARQRPFRTGSPTDRRRSGRDRRGCCRHRSMSG